MACGLGVATCGFGMAVLGCGPGLTSTLPAAVIDCQLRAFAVLPEDPKQATAQDAIDLIQRRKACALLATAEPDAGG